MTSANLLGSLLKVASKLHQHQRDKNTMILVRFKRASWPQGDMVNRKSNLPSHQVSSRIVSDIFARSFQQVQHPSGPWHLMCSCLTISVGRIGRIVNGLKLESSCLASVCCPLLLGLPRLLTEISLLAVHICFALLRTSDS